MTHKAETESYMAQFITLKGLREEYLDWLAGSELQKPESKVYTGLQLIPTGEHPGEYWFTDNFGKRLFRVCAS